MPYISSEEVKQIRTNIKKTFPEFKMSVTKDGHSGVTVSVMEGPYDFGFDHKQINHLAVERHHDGNDNLIATVKKIDDVLNKTKTQVTVQTDSDYGGIPNFYYSIQIGKWNKPYKKQGN